MNIREILEIIEDKVHQHMTWVQDDYELEIVKGIDGKEFISMRIGNRGFYIIVHDLGEVSDEDNG